MQQQNIPIGTLVDMYKRGESHPPEIQRHYVWRATRVRDLLDSLYETGEITEIANMAFITGQTNRRIGNKDATGYLADVVTQQGEEALSSPCVPSDPAHWATARYRDFLALRREKLAVRMNAFIKDKAGL